MRLQRPKPATVAIQGPLLTQRRRGPLRTQSFLDLTCFQLSGLLWVHRNLYVDEGNRILILDRLLQTRLGPPSFSPQWEFRALSACHTVMAQRGYGNEDTAGSGRRSPIGPIVRAIASQFLTASFRRDSPPCHSHRSGNPEPSRCANTVMAQRGIATKIRQVFGPAFPLGPFLPQPLVIESFSLCPAGPAATGPSGRVNSSRLNHSDKNAQLF